MDARMERLLEAVSLVDIDRRDREDLYNLYQFVSLAAAVDAASSLFQYRGEYAPTIEDLEDDDFLANYDEA